MKKGPPSPASIRRALVRYMKARKRIAEFYRDGSTAQESKAAFDEVAGSEAALLALGNRLIAGAKTERKK